VQAVGYKADCADMMDMMLSWALCKLDPKAASSLRLRRLAPGKYEIDGRRVTVVWVGGKRKLKELAAIEDDVPGSVPIPIRDYLNQAARVASFMQTAQPRGPELAPEGRDASEYDTSDPDRVSSMKYACQQAGVSVYQQLPSKVLLDSFYQVDNAESFVIEFSV
jgi:hypothetical protein